MEKVLKKRAQAVATKIVDQVSHTMSLEKQSITTEERRLQIDETANDLIRTLDKRLWETT